MTPQPRSSRSKTLLTAGATILFAVGLYVGFEIAKPPPRPDFGGSSPADSSTGPAPKPELGTRSPGLETSAPEPTALDPTAPESATLEPTPLESTEPLRIERQPPPPHDGGPPRISIVVDDLGRGLRDIEVLKDLGVPLTYSVLPFETHTEQVVAKLRQRGVEYLCHLPMEAKSGANPGPGALLLTMGRDQLQSATEKALAAVPGAAGVNNHMGSGMLSQQEPMAVVLEMLSRQGLYFLDSRTSADTVGYSLARHMGMRAAERQIFLDTVRDGVAIRAQFDALLATARKRGSAIAIAHPYHETLQILAVAVPAALAEGFEFVTVSALLEE